jgi:multicomponent Na+:H+ antiporter subunit F
MFDIAAMVVLLAALLVLYRAYKGPKIYDRVLAVNVIGTKTVVLIALVGFIFERPHFLDIALVYALINFMATMAILKYQESRRIG